MSKKQRDELDYIDRAYYSELIKLEDRVGDRLAEYEMIGMEDSDEYRRLEKKMERVQDRLDMF